MPADAVSFTLLQEQLHAVLDTLSEREAGVVFMRFGLTDGQPKTLDEIGKVYGVTRERIRQIESKTMSKLRHPAFGRPLYSSVVGMVVVVHDGEPDHEARRSPLTLIPYGLSQSKRIRRGAAGVAGRQPSGNPNAAAHHSEQNHLSPLWRVLNTTPTAPNQS